MSADSEDSSSSFGPSFVDHRFVECNEVNREICKLKAEQECKQKRTFTKWINAQLRTHWSKTFVVDLYVDIQSGVMLCYLVETVTDRKLAVNAGRRLKRIHHISNFNMVLSVLRQYGLELVNNNPVDLANGNPPIVLGLIWQIILHFEIKRTVLWLLKNDSSGVIQNAGELSVEKWLLQWLRNEIAGKYGADVSDLDRTWKDGVLFNALIHHADPSLVDMNAVRRNANGRRNLEHAFAIAEQKLNIPRLLDPDDVDCAHPDKRSIMTYLVQFLRKTADRRAGNSAAELQPSSVDHVQDCGAIGVDLIRAAEEDNDMVDAGPLGGPLCREDITHQLRIIQMWLETTNAFLARQTATAAALNEQIDAIMNHQSQMTQIEHVLLFIERATKLRSNETSIDLAVTKRQYHTITKPAIPAKLKALKLIKPQLTTLDEKWAKLTKCLKGVAESIEADEDLHTIDGDLKEIAEDLMTAQVLTDSICQEQNKQHVNVAIINEKTRQLCTQFDLLKVQLSGQTIEEELASFQVAEQAVTDLIGSFEQEIQADSKECTSDMRARAPSFALISTYPVLFDIERVNSEMMGKISKMRQTIVHISDKNKSSAEERIASVALKWTGVLEKLKAFNDRVQHQMKKDEHLASCRSQYDMCRTELEYRLDRAEQLCAKQKHLRKSQIFLQVKDAHVDLKQQEKMLSELEALKHMLVRQRQLLANLGSLVTGSELTEAKQEIVGYELRLDMQCEEIKDQIAIRTAGLRLINDAETWVREICEGRRTVQVGSSRKELLKTLIKEADEQLDQFEKNAPDGTVKLLGSQAQERLKSVCDDLKQQLALVEYNEWFLAGVDDQLRRLYNWTDTTLIVCRAEPASPRSAVHQLEHIDRLIDELPREYQTFVALKTGCPPERTNAVRQLDAAFNDIRTKLITAKQDLGRYIASCDYLAQTAQWLNATEHKLASLELVAEMDVPVAFEVLSDVRKDVDGRRNALDAIVEEQPATEKPANVIRQRMSEIANARLAECETTLHRKLDMFQQLEQLAEFYQMALKRESDLGIVPVNQTMAARVENSSLAREVHKMLNSVGELKAEVDALESKFFQVECDRIRERFYYLIGQLKLIHGRCDRREEYFEKLSDITDLATLSHTDDETTKQGQAPKHSTTTVVITSTTTTSAAQKSLSPNSNNTHYGYRIGVGEPVKQLSKEQELVQTEFRRVSDEEPPKTLPPGKLPSLPLLADEIRLRTRKRPADDNISSSKQSPAPESELSEESGTTITETEVHQTITNKSPSQSHSVEENQDMTLERTVDSANGTPAEVQQRALVTILCTELTTIMTTIYEQIEHFTQRMKSVNLSQPELCEGIDEMVSGQKKLESIRKSIPADAAGDDLRRMVDRELATIERHLETFHKTIDEMNRRQQAFDEKLDQCGARITRLGHQKNRLEVAARTTTDHDPEYWKQLVINLVEAQDDLQTIRASVAELAADSRNPQFARLVATLQGDVDQHSNDFQALENQVRAQLIATKGYQEVADNTSALHRTLVTATTVLNDETAAAADFDTTLQKLQSSRVDLEKVERAYKDIPTSSQYDELRAKLAWDLSKQRECLNKLAVSLQDRCQLYAEYREQSTKANKELEDIEALATSDSQAKRRKGKKRKDLSKKEQVEQTERALTRLAAHEETVKNLRRLAGSLLPSKAPMTAVEKIESKNAALRKTYEQKLALLRKPDVLSQSSESSAEAHSSSRAANMTESSQKDSSSEPQTKSVLGAATNSSTIASSSIPKTADIAESSTTASIQTTTSYATTNSLNESESYSVGARNEAKFAPKIIINGEEASSRIKYSTVPAIDTADSTDVTNGQKVKHNRNHSQHYSSVHGNTGSENSFNETITETAAEGEAVHRDNHSKILAKARETSEGNRGSVPKAAVEISSNNTNSHDHSQRVSKKMAEPLAMSEKSQVKRRTAKTRKVSFEHEIAPRRDQWNSGSEPFSSDHGNRHGEEDGYYSIHERDEEVGTIYQQPSSSALPHAIDIDTRNRASRFFYRRYLCVLIPLLGLLLALLLLALLVPYCEDDWCRWTGSFRRGFEPVVEFVNGPPPV